MIKYLIIGFFVFFVITTAMWWIAKKCFNLSENLSDKKWYAFSGTISCISSSVAEYVMLTFFRTRLSVFFITIMSFGFALIAIYGCWCIYKMMKSDF